MAEKSWNSCRLQQPASKAACAGTEKLQSKCVEWRFVEMRLGQQRQVLSRVKLAASRRGKEQKKQLQVSSRVTMRLDFAPSLSSHSVTQSLKVHSVTHSLSLTHSLTHSLTNSLTRSVTRSLAHSLSCMSPALREGRAHVTLLSGKKKKKYPRSARVFLTHHRPNSKHPPFHPPSCAYSLLPCCRATGLR